MWYNPFIEDAELYRFDNAYKHNNAGWNIEELQAPVKYLLETGQIKGSCLDVGCGTGFQTVAISSVTTEVLGVDFSPEAVRQARERAESENSPADFLVWNAMKLSKLSKKFDTVLDSAMMHCLNSGQRQQYVNELERVLKPNGRFFLVAGRDSMSEDEIRERFKDWKMNYIYGTEYRYTQSKIPAYLVSLTPETKEERVD